MRKNSYALVSLISLLLFPSFALAQSTGDLALPTDKVWFSTNKFLEGANIKIYATVINIGRVDLKGNVRFFDDKEIIKGDQPVSVLAGKDDTVFVDWYPTIGTHDLKISLIPFENPNDNAGNNTAERQITVLADTDRDGIPNNEDLDDDGDGIADVNDAFPLNPGEWLDSDGDTIGNNADTDDDNDGTPDKDDALPLNAKETLDTDKDGIGDNEDLDDDGDGLLDTEETVKGTDPKKWDTDGDTVNDKEDAFPLDKTQSRDYDRDGISDNKDADADNDGIAKAQDVNDTNLGPFIVISTGSKSLRRIILQNETVQFETTGSSDPDGKVVSTEWLVNNEKTEGATFSAKFPNLGSKTIKVILKDDKNETREKTFEVLVIPGWLPFLVIAAIIIAFILAMFFLFSYSKRRRPKFLAAMDTLNLILNWLPKPKNNIKK